MGNDDDAVTIGKAHFTGHDVQTTNARPIGEDGESAVFKRAGSIEPPYNPQSLCMLFEHSNALRQNVDSYAVNIDGNGHRFEPVFDLDSDDAVDSVRDAMLFDRIHESDGGDVPIPSDAEVEQRIEQLRSEMRIEHQRLVTFFDFACIDEPFVSLRKKMRQDKEVMGNGYWEVLRNANGEPARFNYIPAFTMRLLPRDKHPTEVTLRVKQSALTITDEPVLRFFRRYVQVHEGSVVYFKEYGDPRVMSHKTGRVYDDVKALQAEEAGARPATEVIHFAVHSSRSPYGVPRWAGTLISVLGSRQCEEVNQMYFNSKSVPPLAILVSGGTLAKDSTQKIQDFIKNRIHGKDNFHSVMVLEALPSGNAALDAANGGMKIEIVPLTMAQQKDALFQNYDERNIDKIGMQFRLPRMLRGDIRDFNRSTSESALEFAEMQVFAPERNDFDFVMNRKILPDLGIRFHTFASNSPNIGNPIDLSEMIIKLVSASILTPGEGRELAKGVFNRDFKRIDEVWAQIPPDLLKAGILPEEAGGIAPDGGAGGADNGDLLDDDAAADLDESVAAKRVRIGARYRDVSAKRDMRALAKDLIRFREILDDEAERARADEIAIERERALETEVIQLSAEEYRDLLAGE